MASGYVPPTQKDLDEMSDVELLKRFRSSIFSNMKLPNDDVVRAYEGELLRRMTHGPFEKLTDEELLHHFEGSIEHNTAARMNSTLAPDEKTTSAYRREILKRMKP